MMADDLYDSIRSRYHLLGDEDLARLARSPEDLSPAARRALQDEVASRSSGEGAEAQAPPAHRPSTQPSSDSRGGMSGVAWAVPLICSAASLVYLWKLAQGKGELVRMTDSLPFNVGGLIFLVSLGGLLNHVLNRRKPASLVRSSELLVDRDIISEEPGALGSTKIRRRRLLLTKERMFLANRKGSFCYVDVPLANITDVRIADNGPLSLSNRQPRLSLASSGRADITFSLQQGFLASSNPQAELNRIAEAIRLAASGRQ